VQIVGGLARINTRNTIKKPQRVLLLVFVQALLRAQDSTSGEQHHYQYNLSVQIAYCNINV